ncbi:MAG: helix-turn-helix domain-containing protein [Lachnospiraceae bacterium]|nr:helix-turn-helix domain-containing protein [Lachnospiraceae bacterium]
MQIRQLTISTHAEESFPDMMNPQFPYIPLYADLSAYVEGYIPWHWHKYIEMLYILEGSLKISVSGDNRIFLKEGDGCYIAPGTLHEMLPEPGKNCIFITQIFDQSLIAGKPYSIFEHKYVFPVLDCSLLKIAKFKQEPDGSSPITNMLKQTYLVSEKSEIGYEFSIRNILSDIWLQFYKDMSRTLKASYNTEGDLSEERIKKMLIYIEENYQDDIQIADIAQAGNVSSRECHRCFQANLGMTPFNYLINLRIRIAKKMLVSTNDTVTSISADTGFSSSSYFTRVFKNLTGMTPREFRKENSPHEEDET